MRTFTSTSTIASSAGAYYIINSPTVNHTCHAQSAAPSSGTWVIGFLASSSTTSGAVALVAVNSFVIGASSSGGEMIFPAGNGSIICSTLDLFAIDSTHQSALVVINASSALGPTQQADTYTLTNPNTINVTQAAAGTTDVDTAHSLTVDLY